VFNFVDIDCNKFCCVIGKTVEQEVTPI